MCISCNGSGVCGVCEGTGRNSLILSPTAGPPSACSSTTQSQATKTELDDLRSQIETLRSQAEEREREPLDLDRPVGPGPTKLDAAIVAGGIVFVVALAGGFLGNPNSEGLLRGVAVGAVAGGAAGALVYCGIPWLQRLSSTRFGQSWWFLTVWPLCGTVFWVLGALPEFSFVESVLFGPFVIIPRVLVWVFISAEGRAY